MQWGGARSAVTVTAGKQVRNENVPAKQAGHHDGSERISESVCGAQVDDDPLGPPPAGSAPTRTAVLVSVPVPVLPFPKPEPEPKQLICPRALISRQKALDLRKKAHQSARRIDYLWSRSSHTQADKQVLREQTAAHALGDEAACRLYQRLALGAVLSGDHAVTAAR